MRFPEVTLVAANRLSHRALADLVNQAYADYFFSVWLTPAQFRRVCYEEDIDLGQSVVALAGDEPIGQALVSIRGSRGWVSGVGVVPFWRRRGVAKQILIQIQEQARGSGLSDLRLEVLAQNTGALALYTDLGFERERDLLILIYDADPYEIHAQHPALRPASPGALLTYYAPFHDTHASWQREYASLAHREQRLQGLGHYQDGRLTGYILYESNFQNYSIADLAVDPGYPERLQAARAMLAALQPAGPDLSGYAINIADDDPLLNAYLEQDYQIWHRQHELRWIVT